MQDPVVDEPWIDCRTPKISLRSMFERDRAGGVQGWFGDRDVAYSVYARAAILEACKLLDLGSGDEILAPAYNCGAEIDPLLKSGSAVTLYAVDRSTNINLEDLERRISPRTKAIYVIHYFGFCQPEIEAVQRLCRAQDLYLIEDCALGLFSESEAGRLGSFGDVSIFSFSKYFPVVGGGALVVNNAALGANIRFDRPPPRFLATKAFLRPFFRRIFGADRLRLITVTLKRALGRSPAPEGGGDEAGGQVVMGQPDLPAHYYFDTALESARMSAFARWPLRSFNVKDSIRKRRANYRVFLRELSGLSSVRPLLPDLLDGVCPLAFPIIAADRDGLCDALKGQPISSTTWWVGYHRALDCSEFTDTHFLKNNVLTLPVHQFLNERQIVFVANQIKRFVSLEPSDARSAPGQ